MSHMQLLMPQAETLIVWTEPSTGIDMALSFQEADGCAQIWFVATTGFQQLPIVSRLDNANNLCL
jgi:hypothetical protein